MANVYCRIFRCRSTFQKPGIQRGGILLHIRPFGKYAVWPVAGLVFLLAFFLGAPPAAAADTAVQVTGVSAAPQGLMPGEKVQITVKWTNEGDDAGVAIRCRNGDTELIKNIVLTKTDAEKEAVVDLDVDWSAHPGKYAVAITAVPDRDLYNADDLFTINEHVRATIEAPAKTIKSPGDTLTVRYNYQTNHDLHVFVRLAESRSKGAVVASEKVPLVRAGASGSATLQIPPNASHGEYDLGIATRESTMVNDGDELVRLGKAVTLQPKLEAAITAPTRSDPAAVRPGESITVGYRYAVEDTTVADVRLLNGKGGVLVSTGTLLRKGQGNGGTTLTIPEKTALGRYDLEIRAGDRALDLQKDAVVLEHRVTADLTAPTRSKSVSVTAGEKVTVEFRYTASDKSSVEVKIQEGSRAALVTSTVTLEQTPRSKSKSVTLTVPKDATAGRYDLVVEAPLSGKILDTERDAVRVGAKVTAQITGPTKAEPETVRAGDRVTVKFDYTASTDAGVEIKILDTDDKVLTSRTASVGAAAKKESKTITVNIPARAAAGKYNVKIYGQYGDQPLSAQEGAVIVEDPLRLTIQAPTREKPALLGAAGKFAVHFRYTAAANSGLRLDIRKPDGRVLVSQTVPLQKTSSERAGTAELTLPSGTPPGNYDLTVLNRDTGNELAHLPKAVQLVSYPLGVQVQLVIGQTGRWVNGNYQPVDLAPRIMENRTLLPIRHLGEPLGWRFNWDNGKKEATVVRGEKWVRVWVNSGNASVSDDHGMTWRTARIDPDNPAVTPALVAGRVLLPLRFVGETLDTRVDWNAASRTVTVTQS